MASRAEDCLLETYARTLLEASKSEGRLFENLRDLEVIANASPEVMATVETIDRRGDSALIKKVCERFRELVETDDDVVGVEVTTAVPLDDHLRSVITKKCENDFGGREVFLIEHVDPQIIGGIVLEARGKRRDVSVRTQLAAARDVLAQPLDEHEGGAA